MAHSTDIPLSIQYIINMLIKPLTASYPAQTINVVTLILQKELLAQTKSGASKDWQIYLPLHPSRIPPRAILSACIASGIKWPRWILHLGGKEMTFGISSKAVVAHFPSVNMFMTLWEANPPKISIPTGWASWQPPTPRSGFENPDEIPVSPPKSSLWSSVSSAWRPDSPSCLSAWEEEEEEDYEDEYE